MNAPQRQESRVTCRLLGAVEALDGARGVGREEQTGLVGLQAEALARLGSRDGREAIEIDAVNEVVPLGKLREKALAASQRRKETAK